MQKSFQKWAIWIVAFLLCFSFVVNVHCVLLVQRYREIYLVPPVWVNEKGEPAAGTIVAEKETIPLSEDVVATDGNPANHLNEQQDSETSVKAEENTLTDSKAGNTVYLTKSGTKFHREGCKSLAKSKIPISYEDATARGFEPCTLCKP